MLMIVLLALAGVSEPGSTTLGIEGGRFTINGAPTFLLGFSYYAGLGAPPEFVRQDLDDFHAAGFNWLRVFATLSIFDDTSAVAVSGQPRALYLGRLKALLSEADRRGMVVDVTLARGVGLPHLAAHRQAVETLTRELQPWRNAYFDLANERDLAGDGYVNMAEVADLARRVKQLDPARLLTASDCDPDRADLQASLAIPQLDFLSPHRWRDPSTVRSSRAWTEQTIAAMRDLGRVVPLHYQEPFRRGFATRWEPVAADFVADLKGAVEGGAAGWCLHNGPRNSNADGQRPRRSFDLRQAEGRLMSQLDDVERQLVAKLAALVPQRASRADGLPWLAVDDDQRHLVTATGTPFFWLGDTAWWLLRLSDQEIEEYLAVRREQGFNGLQVDLNAYAWRHHWRPVVALDEFTNPFVDDDPGRPDEAYWRRVDGLVDNAARHGLYVMLTPMWGMFYPRYVGLDARRAQELGRWLGVRYRDRSNVLWFVAGEYDSINRYKPPITSPQRAVLNAVARGLEEGHGGRQLMTIHPGVSRTSSADFHEESWLDFNMLQSGHAADGGANENHLLVAADYERRPAKPVFDGEPAYEDMIDGWYTTHADDGPRIDATVVRRKAYGAVFAGAFGHTYGHADVQIFWSPGKPRETANRNHWRDALHAPGAEQMRHLRALLTARPLLGLRPEPHVVVAPRATGPAHLGALRADDGAYALVYLPHGGSVTVDLTRLTGPLAAASWFDPRTGGSSPLGRFPVGRSYEWIAPTSGDGEDWVLVLESAALPPAGE